MIARLDKLQESYDTDVETTVANGLKEGLKRPDVAADQPPVSTEDADAIVSAEGTGSAPAVTPNSTVQPSTQSGQVTWYHRDGYSISEAAGVQPLPPQDWSRTPFGSSGARVISRGAPSYQSPQPQYRSAPSPTYGGSRYAPSYNSQPSYSAPSYAQPQPQPQGYRKQCDGNTCRLVPIR